MSEHTQLPWFWDDTAICGGGGVLARIPNHPENGKNWANDAAFIVKACEDHDRLIRENEAMRSLLLDVVREYPIASGLYVDLDGQDGYGPLKAARKYLGLEPNNSASKDFTP
jgi:hypothetical protein